MPDGDVISRLAANVPDLGRLKPLPEGGQREAVAGFELLSGMRCGGCFRRITQGVKMIRFVGERGPDGSPRMKRQLRAACLREDCDYVESQRSSTTAAEMVEFAWFVGDPDPDGSLTRAVTLGTKKRETG